MRLSSSPKAISKTLWWSYSMPGGQHTTWNRCLTLGCKVENEATDIGRDPIATATLVCDPDQTGQMAPLAVWAEKFRGR